MDLEKLTQDVIKLVHEAGDYARDQRQRIGEGDVEVKGHGDYVSRVDKKVEEMLRDGLTQLIPDSTVMAEESTPDAQGGSWRWIVDPIDGTTNYLIGVPVYAISVALEDRRQDPARFGPMAVGVVSEPGLGVTYEAWRGGGARRNGKSIQVNKHRELHDATVATAFPFRERDRVEDFLDLFRDVYPKVADFRRIGAAAADLCWVADGTLDGYFEMALKPWDVAAGALIIRESGGIITDWWEEDVLETGWVVTGGERLYKMLKQAIDSHGFERPQELFR